MTVPVLRCLVKKYPDAKITLVSKSIYKPIFKEFKTIDFFDVDFKSKYKGIQGLVSLFKDLKKIHPTHIADLHSVLRTNILYILFKIFFFKAKKVDKQRLERKKLFKEKNKFFKPLTPMPYKYCEVFNKLGFSIDLTSHKFPCSNTCRCTHK
jgi:ADP-heptose:LPS heptosyltransferase